MTNDTTPAPIGADALIDELDAAAPKAAPDEQPGAAYAELPALFREALAWGMTYGPEIPAHQWDEMRESMVKHYTDRALRAQAAPAAVAVPSERVAFEMWVRKSTTEVPHRDRYGFYDEPVSEWWKVWQARAAAPTTQATPQPAVQQGDASPTMPKDIEMMATNRYRPVPSGVLAYKVVGGDGTRALFFGTKGECQSVAGRLTEAFLDGAHVALSTHPAAPVAQGDAEDAARLDFMIEHRAYVVSDPDACPGYWLHFVHKETGRTWVQCDEHPTPRAAIDAARSQAKEGAIHE